MRVEPQPARATRHRRALAPRHVAGPISKRYVLAALACPLSAVCALGFIGGGAFGAWAGNDLFTLVMSLIQTAMIFPLGVVAGVLLGGVFLLGGALIYVGWILAWRRITGALR